MMRVLMTPTTRSVTSMLLWRDMLWDSSAPASPVKNAARTRYTPSRAYSRSTNRTIARSSSTATVRTVMRFVMRMVSTVILLFTTGYTAVGFSQPQRGFGWVPPSSHQVRVIGGTCGGRCRPRCPEGYLPAGTAAGPAHRPGAWGCRASLPRPGIR